MLIVKREKSICCLALMNIRAAIIAGVPVTAIVENFTATALYPFIIGTHWQTSADIISGNAFMFLAVFCGLQEE